MADGPLWHQAWFEESSVSIAPTGQVEGCPRLALAGCTEGHGWVQRQSSVLAGQVVCIGILPPPCSQMSCQVQGWVESHNVALKGNASREALVTTETAVTTVL